MAVTGQNAALTEKPTEGVDPRHPLTGKGRIVDASQGLVEFLGPDGQPRKKFALCGFASSTRDMAPFGTDGWAIFGMNQLYRHIPRADGWFEIHKAWNTAVVPGTDHAGWLRDCGIPVIMTDQVPCIPTSVRVPIERFVGKFGDYYTSTVAYMVAFFTDYIDTQVERRVEAETAEMAKVFKKAGRRVPEGLGLSMSRVRELYAEYSIGIFGIDLVVGEEYTWQRPCAEFYLGQALARNIEVIIPRQSALLQQRYRYGYQMEPDDLIRDSDIEKRRNALLAGLNQGAREMAEREGALKELNLLAELRGLRERGADVQVPG